MRTTAQVVAAHLVHQAAISALDFGDTLKPGYVGDAYEVWASNDRRTGADRPESRQLRADVQRHLESLGYRW